MCVASATIEKGHPMHIFIEEEIEKKLTTTQMEKDEEHSIKMFTQWEKEFRMLEDWLCHPSIEVDFPNETVMQSKEKFHP